MTVPVNKDNLMELIRYAVTSGTAHAIPAIVDQWADGALAEIVRLRAVAEHFKSAPVVRMLESGCESGEDFGARYAPWFRRMVELTRAV